MTVLRRARDRLAQQLQVSPVVQGRRQRRPVDLAVVGLGNPGARYAQHRHNVGFWCVDLLAKRWGIEVKGSSRYAATGEGEAEGRYVLLVKPRTFVNRSGEAVGALMRSRNLSPPALLVIYDELDLPLGQLRVRARGSHGGHNGLKSIISAIGSTDFPRIRIGIGRPLVDGQPTTDPEHVAAYVLSPPTPEQRELLEAAVARAADAVVCILREGVEAAMNQFNR